MKPLLTTLVFLFLATSAQAFDPEHMVKLFKTHSCEGCDLSRAEFNDMELANMNLKGANLKEAGFEDADLTGINFSGANLEGADFESASIEGVDFSGAFLYRADFDESSVEASDFSGAFLVKAENFSPDSDTRLDNAVFVDGSLCMKDSNGSCERP